MRLITDLSTYTPLHDKIVLSIGNFDGLHLGHQALLAKLKEIDGERVALTFSTHPDSLLRETPPSLLLSLEMRLELLSCWVETTLLLPFTKKVANLSAKAFLTSLRTHLPFTHLLLGHDSCIGKNRKGCQSEIQLLSKKMNFQVDYLPPFLIDGLPPSSSLIRKLIAEGKLEEASRYLGRPYQLISSVRRGKGHGRQLGFPTINLSLAPFAHPPSGVYAVECEIDGRHFFGVANLGVAPTLWHHPEPLLEIHLFDFSENLYGKKVAVRFLHFIREEMKFKDTDELRSQIERDCREARELLIPFA